MGVVETDVTSTPGVSKNTPSYGESDMILDGFYRIARQPHHPFFHADCVPRLGLDDVLRHLGFWPARIDAAKMEPAADLGGHAAVLFANAVGRIGIE